MPAHFELGPLWLASRCDRIDVSENGWRADVVRMPSGHGSVNVPWGGWNGCVGEWETVRKKSGRRQESLRCEAGNAQ